MDKWLTIVTDEYQQTGGKYGSALKLAKRMNVQPPTLNKWLSGTEAKFDAGIQALERLGWNFERARPDYIPDVDRAEVCAKVKAGAAKFVEECPIAFDPLDKWWKKSRYAAYARGGQCYVEVDGNSMSPDYPDGSAIVCAEWNGDKLQQYTPVIARVNGDTYTFKLWTFDDKEKQVVLVPINHAHSPIVGSPSQISPYLIVLGVAII